MPSDHCSNWEYHEWLAEQGRKKPTPMEKCFSCGIETYVPVTMSKEEYRPHYRRDRDQQYCRECWSQVQGIPSIYYTSDSE